MRKKKLLMTILWILVAVNVMATLASTLFSLSIPILLLLLVPVAFTLLHGAMRYRWSGIVIFIVMCLVVSNVLENTGILTGFPFGHYHYTDGLGPALPHQNLPLSVFPPFSLLFFVDRATRPQALSRSFTEQQTCGLFHRFN